MTVSFTFAVECPAGSYYNKDSQTCQKCQEGTYQNSTGQMNCIPCPQGTWTVGIHARNYTECFGKIRLANLDQHFQHISLIIDVENFFKLVSFVFSPLDYCKDKIPPQLHSTDSSTSTAKHSFIYGFTSCNRLDTSVVFSLDLTPQLSSLSSLSCISYFLQKFVSRVSTLF